MSTNRAQSHDTFLPHMQSFIIQVCESTMKLMYLLEGMELMQNRRTDRERALYGPSLSVLNVVPNIVRFGAYDLEEELGIGGRVAQLAYKGWVTEVYGFWEDHTRRKPRQDAEESGEIGWIDLRNDIMGDLGYIRQDMVHNHGRASQANIGRCKVLKWFQPGQEMEMNIRHVMEFMHRMGCWRVNMAVLDRQNNKVANWLVPEDKKATLDKHVQRKVVSYLTDVQQHPDGSRYGLLFNVLFDDGITGCLALEFNTEQEAQEAKHEVEMHARAMLDEVAHATLPDGRMYDLSEWYAQIAEMCLDNEPNTPLWGPAFQFREH